MDFWQQTNWFAVQAKPFRENLASASVAKLDAEVFLPKVKQEQAVCGIQRSVTKPLFPGYFFARFSPILLQEAVRYARGVLRVVGTSRFPIPLDENIISAVRQRVEDDGFVRLTAPSFQPGDQVCIEEGPWQGTIGKFEQEWNDGKRVLILLDAIQQARLLIEKRWLSAVADLV
ncbi:MAG: transcription termination/antitermination NusG family protein [Verrucomicrobiota bacterium]